MRDSQNSTQLSPQMPFSLGASLVQIKQLEPAPSLPEAESEARGAQACAGPDYMSGSVFRDNGDGGLRARFGNEFQGFLGVTDSLQNCSNWMSRKCLASVVFRKAKEIWPGCSHQAKGHAICILHGEPATQVTGGSMTAMFWIYPKADAGGGAEAKFSFCNRVPKQCCKAGGRVQSGSSNLLGRLERRKDRCYMDG